LCAEACKKKIKAFEEEFERRHGFRVSLMCNVVKPAFTVPNKAVVDIRLCPSPVVPPGESL